VADWRTQRDAVHLWCWDAEGTTVFGSIMSHGNVAINGRGKPTVLHGHTIVTATCQWHDHIGVHTSVVCLPRDQATGMWLTQVGSLSLRAARVSSHRRPGNSHTCMP
jgi:methyl coenzyme M reductase beta subunit